ncbi:hypothetical protein KY361_06305 [Candidatus Woesearchaeota archaeon]|nr:hypothetical protein [Candidatus Woesearchaeota archaeon]
MTSDIEEIERIERSRRIRMMSKVIVVLLVFGFLLFFRPDIPKSISGSVVSSVKSLASMMQHEEEPEEKEEPEIKQEEPAVEVKEEKPGTVLRIGSAIQHRGNDIVLTYVNQKETYCTLRVNSEGILITNGTERTVNGIYIKVLEPSAGGTCRVVLR